MKARAQARTWLAVSLGACLLLTAEHGFARKPLKPIASDSTSTSEAGVDSSPASSPSASASASGSDVATEGGAPGERAVHQGWGFAVYQEQRLVDTIHPAGRRCILGSHPKSIRPLVGLEPLHVVFEEARDGIVVMPRDGFVLVDGSPRTKKFLLRFGGESWIHVDRYTVVPIAPQQTTDAAETAESADSACLSTTPGRDGGSCASTSASSTHTWTLEDEYKQPAYKFCHDKRFGQRGTLDHDFCTILDDESQALCPAPASSCPWKRPGYTDSGDGTDKSTPPPQPRDMWLPKLPVIPKPIAMLGTILVLGFVAFLFIRALLKADWKDDSQFGDDGASDIDPASMEIQSLPNARALQLVARAEQARRQGQLAESALFLHLAMLRFLDDEGLARFHPSKTNGDYARALRRHKALRAFFRAVSSAIERVRFGDGIVEVAQLDQNIPRAREILTAKVRPDDSTSDLDVAQGSSRLVLILGVGVGLSSLVYTGCGDSYEQSHPYRAHNPSGLSALPTLLRSAGLDVTIARPKLEEIEPDVGLIVVRTSAASKAHGIPSDLRFDNLLDRDQNILILDDHWLSNAIVEGKSHHSQHAFAGPWAQRSARLAVSQPDPAVYCSWNVATLREKASNLDVRIPLGRRVRLKDTIQTSTVTAHSVAIAPILGYADEPTVQQEPAAVGVVFNRLEAGQPLSGCVYLFSDRDLFTNASLTRADNQAFVLALVEMAANGSKKVLLLDQLDEWVVSGRGNSKSQNPIAQLKASKGLPLLTQLMLFVAVLFIALGAAFGILRDRPETSHKAFVEHVEAIGRHYARTHQRGRLHVAGALAKLVVMRNRDRVRGGKGGNWESMAQHLSEQHDIPIATVRVALRLGMDMASEFGPITPDDPAPESPEVLRALSKLAAGRTRLGPPKHRQKAREPSGFGQTPEDKTGRREKEQRRASRASE